METLQTLLSRLPPLPKKVLVGVSGGADSVALLRLTLLLRDAGACQVFAAHVNHGLRGEHSDGDEAFVRALCAAHAVPLRVYRAAPPPHAGENWAREARYGFFRQAMAESRADALALAHHRDDQAETLLLHLLRGSGLTGLAGMAADGESHGLRVVRPLLGFSRAQLREALESAGQPWREDESNEDETYLRNAVRHTLLPAMERLAPGASSRVAATAQLLQGDEMVLRGQAEAFLARFSGEGYVCLTPLLREAEPMRARIVRLWWQRLAGNGMDETSLSREQTARLLALCAGDAGGKCNLPGGWHAVRGWKCLHLTDPRGEQARMEEQPLTPSGACLGAARLVIGESQGHPGDGKRCQEAPLAWGEGTVLRYPRPGDWICPFGSATRQSLRDYLARRRVDAPFRGRVPVLCRGKEVLLCAGVGAGSAPPFTPDAENRRFTWEGNFPWEDFQNQSNTQDGEEKHDGGNGQAV